MKTVIKNCPAYEYDEEYERHICKRNLAIYETTSDECEDCTDCLLKQIVELCKKQKKWESEKMESGQIIEIYNGAYDFAQKILDLLEIQEFGNE